MKDIWNRKFGLALGPIWFAQLGKDSGSGLNRNKRRPALSFGGLGGATLSVCFLRGFLLRGSSAC